MSSSDLTDFFVHTVTVKTYQSTTGRGVKQYADPVTVPCLLSRKLRFVRDGNGDTVPSQSTLSADIAWADTVTPGSIVTVDGRDTTVLTAAVSTGGALIDAVDRVKAYLQ